MIERLWWVLWDPEERAYVAAAFYESRKGLRIKLAKDADKALLFPSVRAAGRVRRGWHLEGGEPTLQVFRRKVQAQT